MYKKIEYNVVEEVDDQNRIVRRVWRDPATLRNHRIGGPAVEQYKPGTNQIIGEIWIDRLNHGRHREGNLPAEIAIDPNTGVTTREEYYRSDQLHRDDDGPSEIYRDPRTGHVTRTVHSFEGVTHREGDLPAVQEFDPETGHLIREEYYRDALRHRDNGPAIILFDQGGNVIPASLEFFRKGRKVLPSGSFAPRSP